MTKCRFCGKELDYSDGVVTMFEKGNPKICADCYLVGKPIRRKMNDWDAWANNWKCAKAFFESEGNVKTRSRLKDKWYKQFIKDRNEVNNE